MKLILASAGVEGGDLTLKTLDEIKSADEIIIQTALTPAGKYIVDNFPSAVSLDDVYKKSRTYDTLNKNIAAEVLKAAKTKNVIFLTDGGVSENRACGIILKKRKDAIVLSGVTKAAYFAEKAAFTGNYLAISAYEVGSAKLTLPLIVYDVDCAITAGEVKLAVSSAFGDDIPVTLFTGGENKQIPLYELDRQTDLGFLSAIAIGELSLTQKTRYDVDDLLEILRILRDENGCPWDKAQTKESILPGTVEETYELLDAVKSGDESAIMEELGDVVLQTAFQAIFAEERGTFTFSDAISALCEKLITRHTHVFGNDRASDSESALSVWDKNKRKEKGYENGTEYLYAVPKNFPALMRADKVSKRSGKYNMDFLSADDALEKVYEELSEVKAELGGDKNKLGEECGDFLFAAASYVRKLGFDSETALSAATEKFLKRFKKTEELVLNAGKDMRDLTAEELNEYYDESKKY